MTVAGGRRTDEFHKRRLTGHNSTFVRLGFPTARFSGVMLGLFRVDLFAPDYRR
jgi:hypothetical protein